MQESRWQEGIIWYAGADRRAYPRRGRPPYVLRSPMHALRRPNGNTLVANGPEAVEVTRDWEIAWQVGELGGPGEGQEYARIMSVDERLEQGKVLLCDRGLNRVVEVDRESRQVVRTLELAGPTSAQYNPDDDTLIVAETTAHRVREVDWSGKTLWAFGSEGGSGHDDGHLNSPMWAQLIKKEFTDGKEFDGVLIADTENDRVLIVDRASGEIERRMVVEAPERAIQTPEGGYAVTSYVLGFVTDPDCHVRWYAPDNWIVVPTIDATYLCMDSFQIVEFDPFASRPYRLPGSYRMLTRCELQPGQSVGPIESDADKKTCPPIPAFGCRHLTLFVKASAAARLDILAFRPTWSYAPTVWFDGWEVIEGDVALAGDKLFRYHTSEALGIVSLKVTMGEEAGVVDAWVGWE